MFNSFNYRENTPPDIFRFEGLWLLFMVLSVAVTIVMYDQLVAEVGWWWTAVLEIVLIGGSSVLMAYTSRRRSNLARWLLTIASVLFTFPYVVHLIDAMPEQPAGYISVLQISVQALAIMFLFTHASRNWFAGRAQPQMPVDDL